jgi:hypothetical protein
MNSWRALPYRTPSGRGQLGAVFLDLKIFDYRAAGWYVSELRYGRNLNPQNPNAVLSDGYVTCSTKHALLWRLAAEDPFRSVRRHSITVPT